MRWPEALWALTPLRNQTFGAGADPKDGVLIFRLYKLLVVLAVLALAVALVTWLRQRACKIVDPGLPWCIWQSVQTSPVLIDEVDDERPDRALPGA